MSFRGRRDRRDKAEPAIKAVFLAHGWSWCPLSVTGGPDAVVGASGGRLALVEVKTGSARLRASQEAWRASWKGPQPVVLRTPEEAEAWLMTPNEDKNGNPNKNGRV